MLAVPPERVAAAFERLSSGERALLELSLRREVVDPALAELLRVSAEDVARRREAALARLADELDADSSDEVAGVLVGLWREQEPVEEEPEEVVEEEPAVAAEPEEDVAAAEPEEPVQSPRRRAALGALGAALLVGAVVAIAVSAPDGGDGERRTTTRPPGGGPGEEPRGGRRDGGGRRGEEERPGGAGRVRSVRLTPLAVAAGGTGTVRLVREDGGSRLELRVAGLPDARGGSYVAWLYNTIADARRLGRFTDGDASIAIDRPRTLERYRFVDVSREPDDGNPNHSGASVLRAPVSALTR